MCPGGEIAIAVAWINDTFVLLHAFPKKSMKTPQREIDQAIREVKDLRERGLYDE
ncbi:MAG: type II toxin-antitoxin system RelE/ParE family toxin [Oscillospiraceae bacterium]|nr:type II toxin-antitoxin system RelE/ParE family toxin [Oscillospiraceae bacterium]